MKKQLAIVVAVLAAAVLATSAAAGAKPDVQRVVDQTAQAYFVGTDEATGVKTIIWIGAHDTVTSARGIRSESSAGGVTVLQLDVATGDFVFEAGGWVNELDPAAFAVEGLLERASFRASMLGYAGDAATEVPITVDLELTAAGPVTRVPSLFRMFEPDFFAVSHENYAERPATAVARITVDGVAYEAPQYLGVITDSKAGDVSKAR